MILDDLKKLPFVREEATYEVWVALDRIKQEFHIAVRKDGQALIYRLTDTGWMKLSYHVSFETEQDALALQAGSALDHMIDTAKTDLETYEFRVLSEGENAQ